MGGLRVERLDDGAILRLTIDRPERGNSLTPDLLLDLADAVRSAATAPQARAAILTGASDRHFSTGYDVAALVAEVAALPPLPPGEGRGEGVADHSLADHPLERAVRAIDESPLPFVAALNGSAWGGGLELAAACDLRVAAETAKLGMPPAKIGLVYSATGMARFLDLVGVAATKELFLLGEPIDARRAERIGLVNRVVPPGPALEAAALALARTLASNAPLSLAGTKAVLNRFLGKLRLTPDEEREIAAIRARCFRSRDLGEGAAAFLEKRAPRFEGR